ncbi:conserved hypothetical protein [Culex quinquefasciatus]|uniref:Spondin domain-containing protein n=1 Tax=Culex quinquefasciatus TaxID=7176 RepID=B0X917_CULQU|nr:conserved hypothetical protein [Culex quinquefasciatus]|eukprot:XP_001866139.1 conserved hypothetical protein [Culex quinquefasciatus]
MNFHKPSSQIVLVNISPIRRGYYITPTAADDGRCVHEVLVAVAVTKVRLNITGQSHNRAFNLFRLNDLASASISRFAESGHAHALEEELSRQSPAIHDEFHLPKIAKGEGSSEGTFFLDGSHTMVSFITKIVPSPDWFVGLDSYNLCRGGRWADNVTIELSPLDAGTSNGLTFTSSKVANESAERDREDHRSLHEYYGSNNVHKKVKKLKTKQRKRLLKKLAARGNYPRKSENETEKQVNDCRVGAWARRSKSCDVGTRTRTRGSRRGTRKNKVNDCPSRSMVPVVSVQQGSATWARGPRSRVVVNPSAIDRTIKPSVSVKSGPTSSNPTTDNISSTFAVKLFDVVTGDLCWSAPLANRNDDLTSFLSLMATNQNACSLTRTVATTAHVTTSGPPARVSESGFDARWKTSLQLSTIGHRCSPKERRNNLSRSIS